MPVLWAIVLQLVVQECVLIPDYPNILDYLNREAMASVGDLFMNFKLSNPQGVPIIKYLYTLCIVPCILYVCMYAM